MIDQVDYVHAVMFAGLVAGLLLGRRTSSFPPSRLGRACFVMIAVLLALRAVDFAWTVALVCAVGAAGGSAATRYHSLPPSQTNPDALVSPNLGPSAPARASGARPSQRAPRLKLAWYLA